MLTKLATWAVALVLSNFSLTAWAGDLEDRVAELERKITHLAPASLPVRAKVYYSCSSQFNTLQVTVVNNLGGSTTRYFEIDGSTEDNTKCRQELVALTKSTTALNGNLEISLCLSGGHFPNYYQKDAIVLTLEPGVVIAQRAVREFPDFASCWRDAFGPNKK
jgi:hypothetical protein